MSNLTFSNFVYGYSNVVATSIQASSTMGVIYYVILKSRAVVNVYDCAQVLEIDDDM